MSQQKHLTKLVMGDTRIFNSIPIPILLRSVSADTDTYFDTKINTKFQFSIPEVSTSIASIGYFRYLPVRKIFFWNKLISATFPPPRRQKIFGQCTILGVKKNFSEQLIANIAQFSRQYCRTT
jgi:hypothetical protein